MKFRAAFVFDDRELVNRVIGTGFECSTSSNEPGNRAGLVYRDKSLSVHIFKKFPPG